ncbi:MAG: hypothetical protein MJA84_03830 [Firmicutes bacterium]|nr:hypothetical protein [Bacillota bacterium]
MELLVIGAVIGIISCFLGVLFVTITENQKKKALLQQILTKALVELNENQELLQQMLAYLKPGDELAETIDLEGKYAMLLELNASALKSDELSQLKLAGEFMTFVDIKTNVDVNNIIIRVRYVNKIIAKNESLANFSTEEYKTIHHTHAMNTELIKNLTIVLTKIRG